MNSLRAATRLLPLRSASPARRPLLQAVTSSPNRSRRYSSSSSSKPNGSSSSSSRPLTQQTSSSSRETTVAGKRLREVTRTIANDEVDGVVAANTAATTVAAENGISSVGSGASSVVSPVTAEQRAELPAVPATDHLQPTDVAVSSFFALHRPVSIHEQVPCLSSSENFSHLFDSRETKDAFSFHYPPEDTDDPMNFRSLQDAVNSISTTNSSLMSPQSDGMLPSATGTTSMFRPFHPPPPPEPVDFDAPRKPTTSLSSEASKDHASRGTNQTRSVITIVTSTGPSGATTFRATAVMSPNMPFLNRMRSRNPESSSEWIPMQERRRRAAARDPFIPTRVDQGMGEEGDMPAVVMGEISQDGEEATIQAISVRRQRKLKMKKFKLKKLRRRTRHLRRKLENQ